MVVSRRCLAFPRAALLGLGALALMGTSARPAAAADDVAAQCVNAAERGQVDRDEGHLARARAQFASCGGETCPAVVRRECLQWLSDVDARMPTIIVATKSSAGGDLANAAVTIDGAAIGKGSLGRGVPLDPGAHVVRARAAGHRDLEQQIVVREREKDRVIDLKLESLTKPSGGVTTVPSPRSPWLSIVLGGVAVAGGVGFGVLWSSGMDDVNAMRGSCAPYCPRDRIDDAGNTLNLARLSLGIGALAAVGAVVAWFVQPTTKVVGPTGPRAAALSTQAPLP